MFARPSWGSVHSARRIRIIPQLGDILSKDITDPSLYASAHNGSYTVICIPCCLRMNRLETFTSHRLSTYVPNMNATTCHSYAPLPKLVSVSWSQKGLDRLRYLLVAETAIGIAITSFQPLNKLATPDRGFIRRISSRIPEIHKIRAILRHDERVS